VVDFPGNFFFRLIILLGSFSGHHLLLLLPLIGWSGASEVIKIGKN
jgi:uncharacterized membrane protein